MNPLLSEYYGDNTRWFIATVIDNMAPSGYEGRFKIRIHGLHSESTKDIPQHDLPWAQCVLPTTEGGVSGIGRMPHLLPNALVFGFFMDGIHSQTPIILGSIPHVELPTQVQLGIPESGLTEEMPEDFFTKVFNANKPLEIDIKNETVGAIDRSVKRNREKVSVQFFLNLGYTIKQAIGIVASLSFVSGMKTNLTTENKGLADWSESRIIDLKAFSNDYKTFFTQNSFIAYELRGTQSAANIRLLQSDKLEGDKGTCSIFCKYYLKKPDATTISSAERIARELVERIT